MLNRQGMGTRRPSAAMSAIAAMTATATAETASTTASTTAATTETAETEDGLVSVITTGAEVQVLAHGAIELSLH